MQSHPIHPQNNVHAFKCQKDKVGLDSFTTQLDWYVPYEFVGSNLPRGVAIMYDPFVWQKSMPTFAPNFALTKLLDAP
jgi:hypothetical protein